MKNKLIDIVVIIIVIMIIGLIFYVGCKHLNSGINECMEKGYSYNYCMDKLG